ncbi:MAG: hypothetical protein ACE5JL_00900 [Dehalococcoidia bacterium]
MSEEKSLEGWVPEVGESLSLAQVIDLAYDYRGNVTIVKNGGTEIVGYIFNRNSEASEPFIEYFDEAGSGPFTILYSEIENILFTGKDTAAGKSYEAWLKRREKKRTEIGARKSGGAS